MKLGIAASRSCFYLPTVNDFKSPGIKCILDKRRNINNSIFKNRGGRRGRNAGTTIEIEL